MAEPYVVYSWPVNTPLQRLQQALKAHHQALNDLQSALLAFEENLYEQEDPKRGPGGPELLSMADVCRTLGMGKSWTYRRIKSGEIPSVKLGRSIKVKREDLEEYLESRRYQPPGEE